MSVLLLPSGLGIRPLEREWLADHPDSTVEGSGSSGPDLALESRSRSPDSKSTIPLSDLPHRARPIAAARSRPKRGRRAVRRAPDRAAGPESAVRQRSDL